MFWLSMKLEFDKYETIAENTIIIEWESSVIFWNLMNLKNQY
jgi:hypothetical protein